eukprot:g59508.t1
MTNNKLGGVIGPFMEIGIITAWILFRAPNRAVTPPDSAGGAKAAREQQQNEKLKIPTGYLSHIPYITLLTARTSIQSSVTDCRVHWLVILAKLQIDLEHEPNLSAALQVDIGACD